MARIVDPDQLAQGTEVVLSTAGKTVQLLAAGNLDDSAPGATSGVTLQALYSFLKEEWKSDSALNKFRFPLKAFTKNEFQWINGWAPADAQTRRLIRDAGWSETVGAEDGDQYAGIITLGAMDDSAADQGYYAQQSGTAAATTDFDKTGELNEAILIFDASGPADFTDHLRLFLREQGKLYDSYNLLAEQGLALLEPTLYRLPLSNGTDLNVSASDATIDANAPYSGMSVDYLGGNHAAVTTWAATTAYGTGDIVRIVGPTPDRFLRCVVAGTSGGAEPVGAGPDGSVTWEADPGERQIGADFHHFSVIVDGNAGSRYQIYEWGQRQLRKTGDINADTTGDGFGAVHGNVAPELFTFRGADLILEPGVYIDNFDVNDQNNLVFRPHDVDGAESGEITFPFVAAGTFVFSQNIIDAADADTRVVAYFSNDDAGDDAGNDFDTAGAIKVQDNGGSDIDFTVTAGVIAWDYDYDGNTQRGAASAGSDAPVTLQVVGLADFENLTVSFSISRATGQTVNVTANDERNYSNPS